MRKKVILCLLPVLVLLGYAVGHQWYSRHTSRLEVETAVAAVDRSDPGWRIADIEAKRDVIPPKENAALCVRAAFKLIPKPWPMPPEPAGKEPGRFRDPAEQPWLDARLDDTAPEAQLAPEDHRELRRQLRRVGPALAEARLLAGLPRGRYPVQWSLDFFFTPLPHLQECGTTCDLLRMDAIFRAQDKDSEGACVSAQAALNAGRSLGDEPNVVSQLVRITCGGRAVHAVERILAQGEPGEGALADLQHLLEREARESPSLLVMALRGERALIHGMLEAIDRGDLSVAESLGILSSGSLRKPSFWDGITEFFALPRLRRAHALFLRQSMPILAIARLTPNEQGARLPEISGLAKKAGESLARQLLPDVRVFTGFHRHQALLSSAVVALAAERYRRQQGRWPESLAVLEQAKLLREIPVDPFSGKPLLLRRLGDGLVVYSVGPDGMDNGGAMNRDNPVARGTDIGIRLWDPEKRRQAPRPIKPPE